jgi:hypothetical protein
LIFGFLEKGPIFHFWTGYPGAAERWLTKKLHRRQPHVDIQGRYDDGAVRMFNKTKVTHLSI